MKNLLQIRQLYFLKRNAWVRHDEHYHIDFAVKCKGL
jgi:penicillin-insensitive murein DD-endopeptidase